MTTSCLLARLRQMDDPAVLYLIGQLGSGGAERQLYYLLANTDLKATVVSLSSRGFWTEPIRHLGHQVIELKRRGHGDVRRLYRVVHLIHTLQPDVIHIFADGISGLYGRLGALLTGSTPVIVGERGHPASYPTWYRLLLPWLNGRVAAVVCNSGATRDYLLAHRMARPDQVFVIPNGINAHEFQHNSDCADWPWPTPWRGKLIVGTVGHLTQAKSPETFVRMATGINQRRSDVRFVLVGGGPLHKDMQALVDCLGLTDVVRLMGERSDVSKLLRAMDVFVLSSQSEGMPNAVLEAMASRLPCVVTDAGGCREIVISGETGYVVPIRDAEALASQVLYLLDEPELRAQMGQKGYERVRREFDVEVMVLRYSELYRSALAEAVAS